MCSVQKKYLADTVTLNLSKGYLDRKGSAWFKHILFGNWITRKNLISILSQMFGVYLSNKIIARAYYYKYSNYTLYQYMYMHIAYNLTYKAGNILSQLMHDLNRLQYIIQLNIYKLHTIYLQ